jgi:nucleoside recognition membrane protein YjiH
MGNFSYYRFGYGDLKLFVAPCHDVNHLVTISELTPCRLKIKPTFPLYKCVLLQVLNLHARLFNRKQIQI